MAGNWGKKTGNFASRPGSAGRNPAPPMSPRDDGFMSRKPAPPVPGGIVDRVSEALRNANAKNGFVRTDAKK